ncbi:uncharacterized protein SOCE26_058240 [Sorangium cellulosum]|uniref:MalT-like TPR region domain-containing protein n=1 Tax=Sorangium cellulosum TaxID=56 RepID=A0A2L0EYK4_SORCE|nr:tetratricopeptide repeat protein [Sorangium cellulosum]AUX44360.1 uncharacterized protein SOCE26_058240 [Sorangium cellulosum]
MQGAAALHGAVEEQLALLELMLATTPVPEAVAAAAFALMTGVYLTCLSSDLGLARRLVDHVRAVVEPVAADDPIARGWMGCAAADYDNFGRFDPYAALVWTGRARQGFEEAGHRRGALYVRIKAGVSLWLLGRHAEAEQELRATLDAGVEFGPPSVERTACLVEVLADSGQLDEAARQAALFMAAAAGRDAPFDEGLARWVLAGVRLRAGDPAGAEVEARAASALLSRVPYFARPALATVAAAELAQGRAAEALATAGDVLARYEALGGPGSFKEAFARLVHVEALRAAGDHEAAGAALRKACDRLVEQSRRIDDAALRRSFLEGVPENARIFQLTRGALR